MKIYLSLLILYFQYAEGYGLSNDKTNHGFINAKLNKVYNGAVKNGIEDIYFFNLTDSREKNNAVSIYDIFYADIK